MVKRLTNTAVFRDTVLTAVQNSCGPLESSTESMTVAHKVHAYAALLQQTDLRLQHPDWIQPNRQCPMCDSYEARLIKSLPTSIPTESSVTWSRSVIFQPWSTRKIRQSSFFYSLP